MAQSITIWGASYSDVPAVKLPKTGGGTAQFDDTTDANATASDILSGKTAYVNGTKITGTGSGGGSSIPDWWLKNVSVPLTMSSSVVGKYIDNTGTEQSDSANFYYPTLIPVQPSTCYKMITSASLAYFSVMEYDANQSFVKRTLWGSSSVPAGTYTRFIVGSTTAYILFGSNINNSAIALADVTSITWTLSRMYAGFELVTTMPSVRTALKDTGYNTWTPSTTATNIYPTANLGTFTATDIANNEYLILHRVTIPVVYLAGTGTAKGKLLKTVATIGYSIYRRYTNVTSLEEGTPTYGVADLLANTYAIDYYSSNTARTIGVSSGYGIYPNGYAPTFSNTYADSPVITVKRLPIYARCNDAYFSTSMASAVDKTNTYINMEIEVFKSQKTGYLRSLMWDQMRLDYYYGIE